MPGSAQAAWLAARKERLLKVPYFHVVMTLPSELRGLARLSPRAIYGLLMRSANATLLDLARDPHWMGGVPGITSVLHTWSRDLWLHPHMHSVVTSGGLSLDGTQWVSQGRGRFRFPVKVIGRLFRGKCWLSSSPCGALANCAGSIEQRQLELPVSDNYFCRSPGRAVAR